MTKGNFPIVSKRFLHSWLLSSSRMNRKQKFDFLYALDFEATCWPNEGFYAKRSQEIIEFPCIKVDMKHFNIVSQFHTYVKPKFEPILSEFCTELTGILQETVENQPEFPQVLQDFQHWLQINNGSNKNYAFVTCGNWDLGVCLPSQCRYYGLETPKWAFKTINLKKAHQKLHGKYPRNFQQIVSENGLVFQGRPHSGLDDTLNTVRVIKAMASKGHIFDYC